MSSSLTAVFIMSCLILGTLTTIASWHLFVAWIGLEINTFAVIPFMVASKHPRAIEASTKYFLIQATASITFLLMVTYNYSTSGQWSMPCPTSPSNVMLIMTLLVKLGVAPFHFWMLDVLQGLNLKTGLMVSTWMKIPPMILLYQLVPSMGMNLMMLMGMLSVIIGAYGMINQTGTRKILAYSSIGNLGWTLAVFPLNPYMALLNFTLYVILSISLFMIFYESPQNNLLEMKNSWYTSPAVILTGMVLLLSLSGLPPLTGFIPKLMIINTLSTLKLCIFATLLMIMSLLATFSYLRLSYFIVMFLNQHPYIYMIKWRLQYKIKYFISITAILSVIMLPILPVSLILL